MASETEVFIKYLDSQREHVLDILEGLDEEQLRRALLPSGWSSLAMVKHLALDVEHYWFRCIVAGESLDVFSEGGRYAGGGWRLAEEDTGESVFALYRSEIARVNEIIAATPLSAPPAQRDAWWGDWDVPDLRFIVLHVIAETACHAGHLDAARELIDGRQYVVLGEA